MRWLGSADRVYLGFMRNLATWLGKEPGDTAPEPDQAVVALGGQKAHGTGNPARSPTAPVIDRLCFRC